MYVFVLKGTMCIRFAWDIVPFGTNTFTLRITKTIFRHHDENTLSTRWVVWKFKGDSSLKLLITSPEVACVTSSRLLLLQNQTIRSRQLWNRFFLFKLAAWYSFWFAFCDYSDLGLCGEKICLTFLVFHSSRKVTCSLSTTPAKISELLRLSWISSQISPKRGEFRFASFDSLNRKQNILAILQ